MATNLLGVVLVELGLSPDPPPEAQDPCLGAEGHVDEPLEEPPLCDGAVNCPEHEAVLPDLKEQEVARGVGAGMHGERLPVHLTGGQRLQVDVVAVLRRKISEQFNISIFVDILL